MNRLDKNLPLRPVLLLAYADSTYAAHCGRHFRRMGWEVHLVASAAEARRLLETVRPRVIVLDTDLPDESGWLLSAKITHADPTRQVVLVAPEGGPDRHQGDSVGAIAVVSRQQSIDVLAEVVLGQGLAEAV